MLLSSERKDWAVVLRNSRGDLVACYTGYLGMSLSALLAESLAMWEALSWLRWLAVARVVIESDSWRMVQALLGQHGCSADWGIYLADCYILREHFSMVSFQWIRRLANRLALTFGSCCLDKSRLLPVGWYPTNISSQIFSDRCNRLQKIAGIKMDVLSKSIDLRIIYVLRTFFSMFLIKLFLEKKQ